GIVPGAVVHQRPVEEPNARVMAIAVVVENVLARELADRHREALDVAHAGNLIGRVLDLLLFAAEPARLPQEEPGDVRRRFDDADTSNLTIGEAGQTL